MEIKTYDELIKFFENMDTFSIAIDGNCGSGKTTLAKLMAEKLNAVVIPMDYFYLPIDLRKPNWRDIPGGNMNFKRLRNEVLIPQKFKEPYSLNRFDHKKQEYEFVKSLNYSPRIIIEGSYSAHPSIDRYSDYKIFLSCSKEKQYSRLKEREKDNFVNFENTWIPKENQYFEECDVKNRSNFIIDTTDLF